MYAVQCRTKVYFLGIIDIFQIYNLQKRMEKTLKTARIKVTNLGSVSELSRAFVHLLCNEW